MTWYCGNCNSRIESIVDVKIVKVRTAGRTWPEIRCSHCTGLVGGKKRDTPNSSLVSCGRNVPHPPPTTEKKEETK